VAATAIVARGASDAASDGATATAVTSGAA
jgi:hypothetical protein